ncbi:PIN2/TERF1-interacting telomerase inhibitor 1-like [Acanthaster planci]|uniref:PIN2/TERF1-interacting telomerase inhibitor 1-like n=1 Tax=Acanthaster planci TaxID=133434 RepID=A0A8B7YRR3_ACAPL|nr:PIN2/TERF1-interacting telomerase inhibitor 1-like [Acanthaster planci]
MGFCSSCSLVLFPSVMAMLAEPKRRQKLSSDPRNKAWTNNENKFGEKLMKKMGWQQGKGLGMNEDGMTSHIKVTVKNNVLGLGCSQQHDDNWIGHQDDFNDLLSSLNEDHGTSDDTKTPSIPQNLQEKSKKAKHRVHYKRFARGKDLSSCSSSDMNCIMGVRSNGDTPNDQSRVQSETNSEDDSDVECGARAGLGCGSSSLRQSNSTVHNSFGVQTVTSSNSIQEYFSRKMKELQEKRRAEAVSHSNAVAGSNTKPNDAEFANTVPDDTSELANGRDWDVDTCCGIEKKRKKSKKKRTKEKEGALVGDQGNGDGSQSHDTAKVEDSFGLKNDRCMKKKKKRKHKSLAENGDSQGSCSDTIPSTKETVTRKKKLKVAH